MHFETHRLNTNYFVSRKIKNMSHEIFCGYFVRHKAINQDSKVAIRRITRRGRKIHDELPLMATKFKEFMETGEVAE